MLFKETIAVYSENDTKPTNTLYGQNVELPIVKGSVNLRFNITLHNLWAFHLLCTSVTKSNFLEEKQ
jgi:hypothetical protein